jgi:iron(III) transport system ATP-binding protein
MRFEIRRLHDEFKITTVHVTHDQSEAMVTSDRIVVMNKGRIEQIDAPHVLYGRPKSRFLAGFIGRTNFLEGARPGGEVRFDGFSAAASVLEGAAAAVELLYSLRPQAIGLATQKPNGGALAVEPRSQGGPIAVNTGIIRPGRWVPPGRCAFPPARIRFSKSAVASGWRSIPPPWYG